jgi:sterol desaturase/sphingolipid hydroxylase (fatty acid hydroxylase superfamily)
MWSTSGEVWLRLLVFSGAFLVLALAERAAPRRRDAHMRARRWPTNLALMIAGAACIRTLLPVTAVAAAELAVRHGWGLLGHLDAATTPLGVVAGVVALDLAVYGQHVLMHHVPALWRLHRVHHADPVFDASTGIRFHPGESLLSAVLKVAVVIGLGASPLAVLTFELLLNASAMFNHADVRMPDRVDRALRLVLVTPDMHRVHHSVEAAELDRNFGFMLPWWDWIFGTYRAQPAAGHEAMRIGLPSIRPPRAQQFVTMLVEPFRSG